MLDEFADGPGEADARRRSPTSGRAAIRTRPSRRPRGSRRRSRRRRPGLPSRRPGSVEATAAWLAGEVRPGDAVLVMGGGRSYRIGSCSEAWTADA